MRIRRRTPNDNNDRTLRLRALAVGVVVFLAVAGTLLPVAWRQYRQNEADLEAATSVQAVETAIRLQQEIDNHLKLLELLRDNLMSHRDYSPAAFVAEARPLAASWPAFQAVNWIEPGGEIRVAVPVEGNRSVLGFNVRSVPEAAPAFDRALEGMKLSVTPPLDLRQGGRGITAYLGVMEGEDARGVINGVFRLQSLFENLLGGGLLERYAIEVTDQDKPVYTAGQIPERFRERPRVSVLLDGRSWQVLLAPRAERAADFAAQFRLQAAGIVALALFGALLAALLTWKQVSLRGSERRFRELNRLLPDMVFECDATLQVTYLNRLAQQRLGYIGTDVAQGIPLDRLLIIDDTERKFTALRDELAPDQPVSCICAVHRRDGASISCEVTLGAIRDGQGRFQGMRGVLRDITERLETERAMNRLAHFDSVTQLPNRAMFMQVLSHELRQASEEKRGLVLMVIDLDNFKSINDRMGPSVGDVLLREAGQRLRNALNHLEYVFRVSGDEFAVLFGNLASREEIARTADLLLDALRQPYQLRSNSEEVIDASLGVSIYPEDATTAEQMYMHADAAVYEAKAEGGRRHRIFTHEISRQLNERKQVEEALRHAVRREELRLHYQPIVDVSQGTVIGLEALIRWEHPTRGLLTPFHFIRVAEETGLIDSIGAWVLQEACRQMAQWDGQGLFVPHVSVNVSPHQVESGALNTDVLRALRDHGVDGKRLILELTESLLMRDVHHAARTLHALKQQGVGIAVDDFGTGYSSLAYLNRLPLDTLKIDRAFIAPVTGADDDMRVTQAVIALARTLKLRLVAEGVETEAQRDFLLRHGCEVMQGYFFGKPVPAQDVPALFAPDAVVMGQKWRRVMG